MMDKLGISAFDSNGKGSPPHMRGKAYALIGSAFILRITPAYAGKSNKELDIFIP